MTVQQIEVGERFVARVYYFHEGDPSKQYVNNFEFVATAPGGIDDAKDAAVSCGEFIRQMLLDMARLDRVVLSTWDEEAEGYDPLAFLTHIPVLKEGANTATESGPLSAQHVLHVRRATPTGRPGKVHIRFALQEADVSAPSGKLRLDNVAGMETRLTNALTISKLDNYFAENQSGPLVLALLSKRPDNSIIERPVMGLEVAGAALTATNHKHYNQGGSQGVAKARKGRKGG